MWPGFILKESVLSPDVKSANPEKLGQLTNGTSGIETHFIKSPLIFF